MSKVVKLSIAILIVLLIVVVAFAGFTLLEKQKIEKEKADLDQQLTESQTREQKQVIDNNKLKEALKVAEDEKNDLRNKIKAAEKQAQDITAKVDEITKERDKWRSRVETITQERDNLTDKIKEMTAELEQARNAAAKALDEAEGKQVEKTVDVAKTEETSTVPAQVEEEEIVEPTTEDETTSTKKSENEEYWAGVLKAKAALEVKIESLNKDLSARSAELVEIKQKNEALQLEIDALKHDKEEVERDIKYKEDMINNLSLELARTKNDKKFMSDRVVNLNEENQQIRAQLKTLTSTKNALEKSIVKLSNEKNEIEKKLGQTDSLIQSKIDEIWEIKDSLDKTLESAKVVPTKKEVELPPIIVSSQGEAVSFNTGASSPGFNGKIISVNNENNFVIVDIGEAAGVRLGDVLSVYRDSKYIARLEVIQVRKDISAADIKDQWAKIQSGDIVR